jgi:hypothetical protein
MEASATHSEGNLLTYHELPRDLDNSLRMGSYLKGSVLVFFIRTLK